jgi:hypothetical protein
MTAWKRGGAHPVRSCPVGLGMLVALVALCGLGACNFMTAPLPPNAEPFAPPAVFARWWALTEACSGHKGDMRAIHWYRVPGSRFIFHGQPAAGYWNSSTNRIVIVEDAIEQGDMVRHEMLHALLRVNGHPRAQFLESCASLVSCQGSCVEDPGQLHVPGQNYAVLPPDSLNVTSHVELLAPESDGQRWLALEVVVRNPGDRAVVVAGPGDRVTPPTFGYDLRGLSGGIAGGEIATDSSTLYFRPLETKGWLFEFRVAQDLSEHHIPPGNYIVRGSYARHGPTGTTIAVSP